MRITIVQGAFFPVPPICGGAVEKIWHRMAIEFAALGHSVVHVSRSHPDLADQGVVDGVRHHRVPGYAQPSSGIRLKWYDLLYSRRACRVVPPSDVVVTNTFWSPLLLRRNPAKVCVSVERMPKGQMRLYRNVARLRATTRAVADAIRRDDPKASGRVAVIPNPIPVLPERPVRWTEKRKTILFVGRIHPEKGIELLLEAFLRARAAGELADWKLQLVGPCETGRGGGGEDWAEQLRTRFASPDVEWSGSIYNPDQLAATYERASLFVYPTLAENGEAMPVAPLEAMAWGTPPLVSGLACFDDYIEHGRNGIVFDHRAPNAAQRLGASLADASRRDLPSLGAAAVRVRESHAPARVAQLFLKDFQTLVS